jgi:hypothetical protein
VDAKVDAKIITHGVDYDQRVLLIFGSKPISREGKDYLNKVYLCREVTYYIDAITNLWSLIFLKLKSLYEGVKTFQENTIAIGVNMWSLSVSKGRITWHRKEPLW